MSAVAMPPVLAGDCEIIEIDLTTRLLKLWQNVSRESANNRFLVEGSKRDECLTTEQVPEVIRSPADVGVRWLRLRTHDRKDQEQPSWI